MAAAYDTVKTTQGNLSGRVSATSPTAVTLELSGVASQPKEVPVNKIVALLFDDDPNALRAARTHVLGGRYEEALAALEKLTVPPNTRKEIVEDIDFYRAFCRGQLALGGNGEIAAAGTELATFIRKHSSSYHWLQANEVVGDLLVSSGAFDKAETYYRRVAGAPWPDYTMRAGVAMGRAFLAQGKAAEADKAFSDVLAVNATGELADNQRAVATIGKARVESLEKKYEEAIATLEAVIAKADPQQVDLLAQAYNAMGTAQRSAGRPKEALLAFLRVELLYPNAAEAHAEALYNLAELWDEVHKPDRAVRARQTLQQQYKNSPWAKKVKP
jgi:tetratricopeptide (TPR) repeat protein